VATAGAPGSGGRAPSGVPVGGSGRADIRYGGLTRGPVLPETSLITGQCVLVSADAANAQFTPPARHDKTVLSVSCLARGCELDDCY